MKENAEEVIENTKESLFGMVTEGQDRKEIAMANFQGDRPKMIACMMGVVLVVAIILGLAVGNG